jgi:hypothetical protein
MIVKRGRRWAVIAESTGKVLGLHETREEAVAQLKAIEAAKAKGAKLKEWAKRMGKE